MLEHNQPQYGQQSESTLPNRILPSQFARPKPPVPKPPVPKRPPVPKPSRRLTNREPLTANGTPVTERSLSNPSLNGISNIVSRDQHYKVVMQTLFGSFVTALECNRNPWDFAVELSELSKLGASKHLLRVMVCDGVIEHRREITQPGLPARMFEPEKDVVLTDRSCFVISEKGRRLLVPPPQKKEMRMQQNQPMNGMLTNGADSSPVPIWDMQRRELRLGSIVVKRFKWPASNQEQVLKAFQEEGWPAQIDDPLPPDPKICPKRRLHDTIKCLNRRQVNSAIKFRGDGTGQGVLLEIRIDKNGESE